MRNPKPPPTASVRPRQPHAAHDAFFDYEALGDEPIVANMRRLQYKGNVGDMSIPTHVDENPYETDSDFDNELVDSSSDDEGPGRCPLSS